MLIAGHYCGIDHSGTHEMAQENEIWANLFSFYYTGKPLPYVIKSALESILDYLQTHA